MPADIHRGNTPVTDIRVLRACGWITTWLGFAGASLRTPVLVQVTVQGTQYSGEEDPFEGTTSVVPSPCFQSCNTITGNTNDWSAVLFNLLEVLLP